MNPQDLLSRLKAEGTSASLKLRLDGTPPSPETLELVRQHRADLLGVLADSQSIPRLPWQLERLLSAAASDVLPKGMQHVQGLGLVIDLGTYTLACAAAYLTGDRDEALRRLWYVHRAWQGTN
jgi:hypothetical protein